MIPQRDGGLFIFVDDKYPKLKSITAFQIISIFVWESFINLTEGIIFNNISTAPLIIYRAI